MKKGYRLNGRDDSKGVSIGERLLQRFAQTALENQSRYH
jgi:hypothetical protein